MCIHHRLCFVYVRTRFLLPGRLPYQVASEEGEPARIRAELSGESVVVSLILVSDKDRTLGVTARTVLLAAGHQVGSDWTEMASTEGLVELTTIGDCAVGKTSIIRRFVFNSFINDSDIDVELRLTGVYFCC